ncbi:retrovirus-related Pol polyprotein from transposon TNT 1-94 [Trichonephila clavipes]|uniref:Retrovirus-related Pol polyprotein from transposon TNT 1-94 n=1 Tax=Trichonephila clavipes TaxID=2585209 RepID=A0A8X6VZ02_TRICX|nr:retrovirus-related Pol polyprotein from transposon TNT 1-94 [Trichonephila clavipes]
MEDIKRSLRTSHKSKSNSIIRSIFWSKYQPGEDVGIFISRVKTAATRLQEAGHKLDDLYIGFQLIRWLPQEFQSTVQQIYRWKEEDFRVVKIEAELILEANRLQLMKQDLEKAENAYLGSFTLKKSKTLPGATAAAHGNPNGKNDYQKEKCKNDSVKGLPRLTDNGKTRCIPCKLAKSKRVSFKKTGAVRSKRPLELLHMDLCGPMPTESQGDLSEQQALMVEATIPNCYKQAIRSRDASKWRDAMDKEIKVMMERKVWDLVDHPDNIKILENRWVYTFKYDENNKIVRYKARLVARGNTQLRGESFDEVFQEYQLELSKVKSLKLRCYSHSDFATNRNNRVSMGGFITFIAETPISSRTFKQKSVSLSTMEAEYVSLTEAAKEFIWLKNVIDNKSLNLELSENVMFCDNQAAISFSKSPVENYRTQHIDVRYHFLRNLIYDKVFKIKYIGTKNNLAEIFTKTMVKEKLLEFCRKLFLFFRE